MGILCSIYLSQFFIRYFFLTEMAVLDLIIACFFKLKISDSEAFRKTDGCGSDDCVMCMPLLHWRVSVIQK
ncbi:hypothetical protein BDZ94DRAFT_1256791 [Collybia nuda]|uniref:Uncharacterized protein n=1 Tax=Collybia nuda TaxID=64659 RepID=A0A9P5Y6M2_9AGAR|nr:hypothetical protein BDZ94DRAFT_1256791 [Collybia nuda]